MQRLLVILTVVVVLAGVTLWVVQPKFGPADALAEAKQSTPVPTLAQRTPGQTVQAFYDWYLDYSRNTGNAMVDKAYHDSPYLTPEYVQSVDELIASFDKGGYDPFLQAQDIPEFVTVEEETVTGDKAVVTANTSFPGHGLVVRLVLADGGWKIDGIARQMAPEQVVESFYGYYLQYARHEGNPLVDGIYKDSAILTAEYIAKVEEILASFDKGGYDPFLQAQDLPEYLNVQDVVVADDKATVTLDSNFPGYELMVDLVLADGLWQINDVRRELQITEPQPAPTAAEESRDEGWQTYGIGRYAFEMAYPADWTMQEAAVEDPENVNPTEVVTVFTGPAAGQQVVVELSDGTLEQYRSIYPQPEQSETVEINGQPVLVEQTAYEETFYIFTSPSYSNYRATVRVNLAGLQGAELEAMQQTLDEMLRTITLS